MDENDIRRQIDAIVKMGIRKYVTYIRDRNATGPDDFDDFPNMLKGNPDILNAFNKNKLPTKYKGCIQITEHNSVPSKYTKYKKRNSPPYPANVHIYIYIYIYVYIYIYQAILAQACVSIQDDCCLVR